MPSSSRTAGKVDAYSIRLENAWVAKYQKLRRLMLTHPETFRKSANPELLRWFKTQRRVFKAGALPYNRAVQVAELDTLFSESVNRWQKAFDRLLAFRSANPNRWPRQDEEYPDGFGLGKWCWRQISEYHHGTLKKDRLSLLREVELPLEAGLRMGRWFLQLRHLDDFRLENPDRWPYLSESFPFGNKLGLWFWRQAKLFSEGALGAEKVKALNRLGSDWKAGSTKYRDNWKESCGRLVAFRRRNPDRWPRKSAKDKAEDKLAEWCYFQRLWRKRGTLTQERFRRLLEIGFPFDLKRSAWLRRLQELIAWRRKHPKHWPSGRSENKEESRLANWMYEQRARRKSGELSVENIRLLSQMGFPWKGKD